MSRRWQIICTETALVCWVVANLFTLTAYPPVTCDEVSYSSPAAQFLENGYWGTQTDAGRDGLDKNAVALGRLFLGSIALSFILFGQSLFAARLASLIFWALGMWGVFLLARRLYGSGVGWLSAGLMAVSWIPLLQGHVARPDMALASAATWIAYLLHLSLDSPSTTKLGATGLASGLLIEIHLNGICFIAATSLLVALFALQQRWQWRWLIAFGAGVLVGGLIWIALHFWFAPPPLWVGQMGRSPTTLGQLLIAQMQSVAQLPDFFVQNYLWGPGLFTGLLALAGIGVALWQRSRSDKFLLGFTAISYLAFGIFKVTKPAYYAIMWIPFLIVFSARGLDIVARVLTFRFNPVRRLWLIGTLVLGVYLAGDAYLLIKFSDHSFDRIARQLQTAVEPKAIIFGDPRAWFALPNRTIIDSLELAKVHSLLARDLTKDEVYELLASTYRSDYLFIGQNLTCFASSSPEAQILWEVASEYCQPIVDITEPWYQPSTLYRCDFAN